ncbi:MAG TPA: PBP1A family penicillin-binding protein [Steroidobacteraceae bacterium]|nr:PBP1A family penicillin-binding protein [Steroidobacteraceae bacterium]
MKRTTSRLLLYAAGSVTLLSLLALIGLSAGYVYLEPSLPSVEAMRNVELQVPLRVYTRDGDLVAQIGEERRIPVPYEQIPEIVKKAFLAAEDDRFFQHHGFDYLGLLRAVLVDIASGQRAQGASTITQQAARNMFLTLDKTWRRKLEEAFLTYRMEHAFSKQQIFGLYLNVIFFGERAYGVAAAAQTYFGKPLDELSLAQVATLAGLPQLPSRYDPIINPHLAQARRSYVLRRMRDLGYVSPAEAAAANAEPIDASEHGPPYDVEAAYIGEMVRQEMLRRYGPRAETAGFEVYTTIDSRLQAAADRALHAGLIDYDRRYGYRGPLGRVEIATSPESDDLEDALERYPSVGPLEPAVVVTVADRSARVYVKGSGFETLGWDGLAWARPTRNGSPPGPTPKTAADVIAHGDVIYVAERSDLDGSAEGQPRALIAEPGSAAAPGGSDLELAQVPEAQAALVSLNPTDGGVAALVGGFDFFTNNYNRAVQARRQPGSGFKPFLYSAALDDGFTPATMLLDAPVVMDDPGLEQVWRPENSHHDFRGPIRMREALIWSRNLASIRLLRQMGIKYASDYAARFGFPREAMPQNLTLALGTLGVTPLELAAGYATFANGGFRIAPYFIDRIVGHDGTVLWQAAPSMASALCEFPASPSGAQSGAAGAGPQPTSTQGSPGQSAGAQSAGLQPAGMQSAGVLAAADAIRGGPCDLPANRVAPRVISQQNDWLMTDLMADVIKHGTGQRALGLHRTDLAGKTGTTNDSRDAWFNGYTPDLVTTVWVGYDQERSLGETEEGSRTALPIWVNFMHDALQGVPELSRPMPSGLVTLRISAETGMLASAENPNAILETFMVNHLPTAGAATPDATQPSQGQSTTGSDSLF